MALPAAGCDPAEVGLRLGEVGYDPSEIVGVEYQEITGGDRADSGAAGLLQ